MLDLDLHNFAGGSSRTAENEAGSTVKLSLARLSEHYIGKVQLPEVAGSGEKVHRHHQVSMVHRRHKVSMVHRHHQVSMLEVQLNGDKVTRTDESAGSNTNGNLSDNSLKNVVFTDNRGPEVLNHFNEKSFVEFEIGVIHEISKYLPTATDGFDQIIETVCRYTYNCYWKGSSHPFIKYVASKLHLPGQVVPRCMRTLGSFVHALQSYKAFDLTFHPDGLQCHRVVITAKL